VQGDQAVAELVAAELVAQPQLDKEMLAVLAMLTLVPVLLAAVEALAAVAEQVVQAEMPQLGYLVQVV
jgi:hypothetical protein